MRYDLFVCTVVFCIWVLALFKYAFRLLFILSLLKKQTAQIIDFRFLCNFFLDFLYFFNTSVISLRSVLLVEETEVPRENHRPAASHWLTLSHNVVSSTPHLGWNKTHNVSGDRHWLITLALNFYSWITIYPLPSLFIFSKRQFSNRVKVSFLGGKK
jgi:hypothetical protein